MYGIYMSVAWSTLWSGMRTLVTSLTMDNISALLKHQTSSQPAQVFFFFCEETQDVLHIKEMKKKDQTQKKKKKKPFEADKATGQQCPLPPSRLCSPWGGSWREGGSLGE